MSASRQYLVFERREITPKSATPLTSHLYSGICDKNFIKKSIVKVTVLPYFRCNCTRCAQAKRHAKGVFSLIV
jgi:hypothetical protein